MSIIRSRRKCNICGRMYDFNPDVWRWRCPYCEKAGKGNPWHGMEVKLGDIQKRPTEWNSGDDRTMEMELGVIQKLPKQPRGPKGQ